MAIKTDGTLWATGINSFGQLGLGDTTDRNTFTQVGAGTDWMTVACGNFQTSAIKTGGTLWGAGDNTQGTLGLPGSGPYTVLTQVGADTQWMIVMHDLLDGTLAIKTDGTLWATGDNTTGKLGFGDFVNRSTYTQVGAGTDWSSIAMGSNCSLVIKTDGTLWGAGLNAFGALGLGTSPSFYTVFTQVGSDTDWEDAHTGSFHSSLAIKTDGTIWGTGLNVLGELGFGDTLDRSVFTQVGAESHWIMIDIRGQFSMAISA
jgi:alpha-tubulin suppressor-like RCC1 family protein